MREFSKGDIIREMFTLPKRLDKKVISERAWLDRLDNLLVFLENEMLAKSDSNYEFFSRYVNLNPRKSNRAHYFEPLAAIILITFLSLYEHPFQSKYMKGELPERKESEDWFSRMEVIILQLMDELYVDENNVPYPNKEFLCTNIISEFAKIAGLEPYYFLSKKADEHANRLVAKLKSLLSEDKAILYRDKLEKYMNNIEREIDKIVKRYDTQEKKLFEIDMEINSGKISDKVLKDIMESHRDKE